MDKESTNFLSVEKGVFLIGNDARNPKKIGPNSLELLFFEKIGFYQEFITMSFFLQLHTARRVNLSVKKLEHFHLAIFSESVPNIS